MNMSIEKMLSHVYEIEGLMLVTRRLGEENTPDVITNKIKRNVRELAEMCAVAIEDKHDAQGPVQETPQPAAVIAVGNQKNTEFLQEFFVILYDQYFFHPKHPLYVNGICQSIRHLTLL